MIQHCVCLLLHFGFGTIGDAQPRDIHHRQIIGPIANGNGTFKIYVKIHCKFLQKACLDLAIDNVTDDVTGQRAVTRFQGIG